MQMKQSLLYSIVINLFFLILCLVFGNLVFGAIDDYFMARILEGVYGDDYNVHLTFVNVLYGYALLPLYHIFPKIGWYYIGELAAVFFALCSISFVIIQKFPKGWGLLFGTLFSAVMASDCYLVPQFTLCASVLSAAGTLLIWHGLDRKQNQERKSIYVSILSVGAVLLIWGSLMRNEALLMGIPLIACMLIMKLRTCGINLKLFLFFSLIVTLILGFQKINNYHYENSEYENYKAFQGPRAALLDRSDYNSQAVYEDFEEMGFNGADFARFSNWSFYDNKVFSLENIAAIMNLKHTYTQKTSFNAIFENLLSVLSKISQTPIFLLWFALGLAVYISEKKNIKYVWFTLGYVLAVCAYLLYYGRLVYRVEWGLWLYAIMVLILYIEKLPKIPQKLSFLGVASILFINVMLYESSGYEVRNPNNATKTRMQNPKDTANYSSFFDYVDRLNDSVLVLLPHKEYTDASFHREPPYLSAKMGSWKKLIPMGFWTPRFPDIEKHINSVGVSNPFEDVVKENVYVVNDVSLKHYLKQHYYDEVLLDSVKSFNGLVLYKYSLPKGDFEK